MSWFGWGRKSGDEKAEREETEKTIAAIFSPSHATVRDAPDRKDSILRESTVRLFKKGEEPAPYTAVGGTFQTKHTVETTREDRMSGGEKPVPLDLLPPCPIAGYELRSDGLVDNIEKPPRTLTAQELRSLVAGLSSIEQRARYEVDTQLPQQVHNRGRRGLEVVVNPCLHMCGLYLMLWKAPRLYFNASPRGSAFFTRVMTLLRWNMPEIEKEKLARKHRRLLQATNARVTLAFLTGVFLTAVAVITRPPVDVLDVGPDVEVGKRSVGFQQHSEAALRWLWLVYYHHPAYKPLAQGTRPPILLESSSR
ncbi:hypothetical protein, conserved [Trypanosoma brucei gambiense DAL972]|uniref:Uncharacterized protein n=2 Tax=Trypanosoma brucei TaxID=5691 RepID=C9ZW90_TRYB9|nr:hypothetical protein, conserved [Trypanosoma brucei gambiense DAL972]RHW72727.1 hypothetical protein DPX39_040056300 [Trypanosoma brucei equiperdum]CBH13679.1 hypothetical protein, conserved [Trypanosoma brucei gambiense DAL972]|eukprot:XP_011775955.1 hypothetical protein, conserved [Trypanosoma brucei gambiense DAL972]